MMKDALLVCLLTTSMAVAQDVKSDEWQEKLQSVIRQHHTNAVVVVEHGTYFYRYHTLTFKIHTIDKIGNILGTPHDEEGPNVDGILLKVALQDGPYQGAAKTPQDLKKSYWTTFINAYPAANGKCLWMQLSYGSKTDNKLLEAIKTCLGPVLPPVPGAINQTIEIEEQNNKVEMPSIIKTEDQGYEEGKKEAEKDFKSGKYQLKKYGLCLPRRTYEQFLKNTYGVSTKVVAGCCVTPEITGNAKGYNEVIKPLLITKYKTDIFLEAEINETLEILENTRGKKFTDEEKEVAIKKIREAKEKEALNKEDASNPAPLVPIELKNDLSAADFKLALVGKWKSVFTADKDNPNVQSLEFNSDGKTDIVIAKADKTEQYSGTYTISFDREPGARAVTMATITIRTNGSNPIILSRVNFGLHNGIPQQEGIVLRIDNEPYGVLKRQADRTDTADVKGTERPDGLLNITGTKTAPVHGEEIPEVVNLTGFASIGWVFSKSKEDLYDMWNQLSDNMKLKGSVVEFMDWPNVSRVIVIYNMWHLPGPPKDIRIQHIENNLKEAAFGDRFKGNNPGGTYIMLFQYDDSKRDVLLCFKDGVFIFESEKGIGAVDIRKNYKQGSADNTMEAAPVIAVLKAAQDSDVTAFRDAYSKRIREGKEQADWENNLKEAQANMKKVFGDYQLKDFSFTFAGDKEKGKVTLSHKGKEAFPLNVIKEDDKWKVDER